MSFMQQMRSNKQIPVRILLSFCLLLLLPALVLLAVMTYNIAVSLCVAVFVIKVVLLYRLLFRL